MRSSPRLTAAVIGVLLTTAACTSHHPPAGPSSADVDGAALQQLRHQASLAAAKTFTATYRAQGGSPERTDTVHVFRTPSALRLDVDESGATVRIVADDTGTYSCKLAPGAAPLCVTLATAGRPLSSSLAAQLQLSLLFTTAPGELAAGAGFEVQPASSQSPSVAVSGSGTSGASSTTSASALAVATCFAIVKAPTGSDVAPGTYCFADGMLVSARYRTGSLQLTAIGSTPSDRDFSLPASPVPLPSGSTSPTPS